MSVFFCFCMQTSLTEEPIYPVIIRYALPVIFFSTMGTQVNKFMAAPNAFRWFCVRFFFHIQPPLKFLILNIGILVNVFCRQNRLMFLMFHYYYSKNCKSCLFFHHSQSNFYMSRKRLDSAQHF